LWLMETAAKLLEEAMHLPADEREDLAAKLLDSLEPPPGISIDDTDEIEKRAAEARSGAPGISWDELRRDLLK
jgi:putative addiction module component (TIGR02574 family)